MVDRLCSLLVVEDLHRIVRKGCLQLVEPPSKVLLQVLFGQKLCSERDLRRCRKIVRRLSGDLPAFDSVWLDALVQTQKLTSYQASLIETGQHENLRIGPSIVMDRIGGTSSETFLARDAISSSLIVVKRMSVPAELKAATLARLQHLIEQSKGIDHPGLVLPHACSELGISKLPKRQSDVAHWQGARIDLAIASRLVEGLTLGELLLRRGRFPAEAVMELARQTLEQLALLHERELVHGELGLQNLRLQRDGQLLLLDAGITPALQPELQINAFVRPDRYDGVAPELIGTGQKRTVQSDLYALGALLWQLFAGRPPFTTGDPLAKLAAHQLQRIPDVRELAPETPEKLARAINWLTERDPTRRPASAKQVLNGHANFIGLPRRTSRSVLASFGASFRQPPARSLPKPPSHFPQVLAAATAAVLLAAATVTGLHSPTRQWVLTELPSMGLGATVVAKNTGEPTPDVAVEKAVVQQRVLPLPKPDPKGVIELDNAGPYRAEKLIWRGHQLTLRGRSEAPATILIESDSLRLRATYEIVCEHVRFEYTAASEQRNTNHRPEGESDHDAIAANHRPQQLVIFESQDLKLTNCEWRLPLSARGTSSVEPSALQAFVWAPHNAQDSLKRRLEVRDSQIVGAGGSIVIVGTEREHDLVFDNLLKADGGPLLLIDSHRAKQRALMTIELDHSTLRNCDGIVALKLRETEREMMLDTRLAITLTDTVLALRSPRDGQSQRPAVALLGSGERLMRDWSEHASLASSGSVTSPGLMRFGFVSNDGLRVMSLDANAPKTTGLISADFTFKGEDLYANVDSLLDQFVAPRRSATLPGIQRGDVP